MAEFLPDRDLLIQYLDGELSDNEKEALQKRLGKDEKLQEELANLSVAVDVVRLAGTKEQVSGIHQQMMTELGAKKQAPVLSLRKTFRYALTIAASVLVIFFSINIYKNVQNSPGKIYDDAFVDYTVAANRGAGDGLSRIEELYQQKSYDEILSATRSFNLSGTDSLLIGLAYLHTSNYSSAISWFGKLSSTPNAQQQDAEFYLSLAYLKNANYTQAAALMQKIFGDGAHVYRQQFSEEMINKVKRMK